MSRHYYDIYMMVNRGIAETAVSNVGLLEEVLQNTKYYFKDNSASYDTAIIGSLSLSPSEDMVPSIEKDYYEMKKMIIGEYPDFSKIMGKIAFLEKLINQKV
jgi:hypothetical protein